MDKSKFQERVLESITESLEIQGLKNKLEPIELIDNRDRYFLINGKNGDGRKKRMVFLRYDKWYFYLQGMHELPPETNKREYIPVIRKPIEEMPKIDAKQERVQLINSNIDRVFQEIKRERQ